MNFSLTSPGQLQLESYQKAVKSLIQVLRAIHEKNLQKTGQKKHPGSSTDEEESVTVSASASIGNKSTLEVSFRSGGVFVLDLSVTEPGFVSANSNPSQAYPLTFLSTSLSTSPTEIGAVGAIDGHGEVLYFIRLPLNPVTHPIQCQLSARRLHAQHVAVLDRILRRLCDSSPGAFMVGYSDGISGVDPGKEVVYSGENSPIRLLDQRQQQHQQQQQPSQRQHHRHNSLETSITQARDHGNLDIDRRVAAVVGHVEHPSAQTSPHTSISTPFSKPIKSAAALEVEDMVSSLDVAVTSSALPKTTMLAATTAATTTTTNEDQEQKAFHEKLLAVDRFIANHDFGMVDDIEQLLDVHGSMDLDSIHDILWVNS